MIPLWLAGLALLAVFVENAIRTARRDREHTRAGTDLAGTWDREFQRLHELLDQVRASVGEERREQKVRQLHAEISKLHRAVIGAGAEQ